MPFNSRSLANLKPLKVREEKETLTTYLPTKYKKWLKQNQGAAYKIERLIELTMRVKLLLDKIAHNYSGYRANGFTKGLRDLEEINTLLKEIL